MPRPIFTEGQVRAIRLEHDEGRLDVRDWCGKLACGAETIRRVARRETYVDVAESEGVTPPSGFAPLHEPTGEELAASLARLGGEAEAALAPAREADAMLDDLMRQGQRDRPPVGGPEAAEAAEAALIRAYDEANPCPHWKGFPCGDCGRAEP